MLLARQTPAQSVFLNFNTPGEYTDNFNQWNESAGVNPGVNGGNYSFEENPTDGVGGSGGVAVFENNDMTATYNGASWNLSTNGANIIASVLMYTDGETSGDKVQFGVINTDTNGLNSNLGVAFDSYRFIPNSATSWTLYEQSRTTNTTTISSALGTVTLSPGRWYKFVVGLTNTSPPPGNLACGCALFDYGTDGLTPGTNVMTFSPAISHAVADIATNAVWPAFRAFEDAGVSAWDNFLVYTADSVPTITLPLTNATVSVDTEAAFSVLADGPGSISYTWYTNGVPVAGISETSFAISSVPDDLTNVTVVAANSNGSVTNDADVTVIIPNPPQVINSPATGIGPTQATLNGQVLSTGGAPTTVVVYYGQSDGGTNPVAWADSVSLGLQSGAFSETARSLSTNTTYYYTASAANTAGTVWGTPSSQFTSLVSNVDSPFPGVLTYHNDNTRVGVNSNETILTLADVNTNSFGALFTQTVDGYVYAQPLIMTNVSIPGSGTHNVVYVVTVNESVYAFDADNNSGSNASPLWMTNFLGPNITIPTDNSGNTGPGFQFGITGTPVIDPVSGTIYVVVKTVEYGTNNVFRLHALDVATGLERSSFNSPVVIQCTNYFGSGTGDNDGQEPPHLLWTPLRQNNRSALTLFNGAVYVTFASYNDITPYHGWVFGYNATNLSLQPNVYADTPYGGMGGIWMGGGGPAVDAQGYLYLQTGNGTIDAGTNVSGGYDYSMSLIKLSPTNYLEIADFFAPSNAMALSQEDGDLGSSGPIVLPDSAGSSAHPHLMVGGGKTPPIYLLDRDNLGRFNGDTGNDLVVQQFNGSYIQDRDTTPAFFNNTLYVFDANQRIGAYSISNALFNTTPVETPDIYDNKGGATVSISANGTGDAIAWAIYNDGSDYPTTPCILRAYNATNVSQELYSSDQIASRDSAGDGVKFTVPTIANGKVYVGAQFTLTVYGLAGGFVNTPVISPPGGVFTNSVAVTLTDSTAGSSIYYTLDGTTPTANSTLYTRPLVLSNSAVVNAAGFAPRAAPSGVATASFLDSSATGTGTGLLGQYWANTTSSQFLAPGFFNTTPTLTRIDPTIDFDWSTTPPATNIGPDTYCVRWLGSVQPRYTETVTFSTSTDAGARLYVDGQLLVNEWVDQSQTTWSGSIALVAQQRYNIEMDYFQDTGAGVAELLWSSPSLGSSAIIPESQLYPVTNLPPSVILTTPTNGATLTAAASVTITAEAASQYNAIGQVAIYVNGQLLGTVTNQPDTLTDTGLEAGDYTLTAVATDTSGLISTSSPVNITVNAGSGLPYGMTNYAGAPAFYNMPPVFTGSLPALLSLTGVFSDTPSMTPATSLVPYAPNVQLFSDNAQKIRYFSIPNTGAPYTPSEQISFAPTGAWSFPAGTVFVKTFELQTNTSDPTSLLRLETRLLVRNTVGTVYGVTYRWRPDYSDADLLTTNLTVPVPTITPNGMVTQMWYFPSPSDCLQCHTAVANYVLGVNERQLNNTITYPNGVTDNELRAINRMGLFNPAIDESQIPGFEQLSALTNTSASYVQRARSYLDANCAQCHQPGGPGPTFDARYDTPLTNQNIIGTPAVKGNLGYDNVDIVTPNDVWRSSLYDRMNTDNSIIAMPPLARLIIDTNAVELMAEWINSLGGTPALPPPTFSPAGGTFEGFVNVTIESAATNTTLYYTLDGSLPTTNSQLYTGAFMLTNSAAVNANAWEPGFIDSVVGVAQYIILPSINFVSPGGFTNGSFQMAFTGPTGYDYVLQMSTNLTQWTSISTNTPLASPFVLSDPGAPGTSSRFYRVLQSQ